MSGTRRHEENGTRRDDPRVPDQDERSAPESRPVERPGRVQEAPGGRPREHVRGPETRVRRTVPGHDPGRVLHVQGPGGVRRGAAVVGRRRERRQQEPAEGGRASGGGERVRGRPAGARGPSPDRRQPAGRGREHGPAPGRQSGGRGVFGAAVAVRERQGQPVEQEGLHARVLGGRLEAQERRATAGVHQVRRYACKKESVRKSHVVQNYRLRVAFLGFTSNGWNVLWLKKKTGNNEPRGGVGGGSPFWGASSVSGWEGRVV